MAISDQSFDAQRKFAEDQASVLAGLSSGTILMTRDGETPVEWLETGDEVLTRDRGFVPIIWVNRVKLDRKDVRKFPEFAPVTIPEGRIEPGFPNHDIKVSPRQLVLIRSPLAERDYAAREVLVPAVSIGDQADPHVMRWDVRVTYAQILLETHQSMSVEGVWLGSLFTGSLGLETACPLTEKLETPQMKANRPVLDVREGRALMQEIWEVQARKAAEEERDLQSSAG